MTGPADAKRVVLAATVITGILTAFGDITRNSFPKPRLAIAGAVVGVTLAAVADVAPQLAKSAALLMAATAFLVDGSPAVTAISKWVAATGGAVPIPPNAGADAPNVSLP